MAVVNGSFHIKGDLHAEEDLRVEGRVTGSVSVPGFTLTVDRCGVVRASVMAFLVMVEGTVEGDIFAQYEVVIRKDATVRGKITAPRLTLEPGGFFSGDIEMDTTDASRHVPYFRLVVDPGIAAPAAVGEFLSELSTLYKMIGGSGIAFVADRFPIQSAENPLFFDPRSANVDAERIAGGHSG